MTPTKTIREILADVASHTALSVRAKRDRIHFSTGICVFVASGLDLERDLVDVKVTGFGGRSLEVDEAAQVAMELTEAARLAAIVARDLVSAGFELLEV